MLNPHHPAKLVKSLSARRAWIEMGYMKRKSDGFAVALRKESVDRNCEGCLFLRKITMSLSARRAWIEIAYENSIPYVYILSLSARRAWIEIMSDKLYLVSAQSLSARRAWIEIDWASVITAMTSRRSPQGERG